MTVLPRFVAIQSRYNQKYLRHRHIQLTNGEQREYLQFSGDDATSLESKFEVVAAGNLGTESAGWVHLKCCYNNKYVKKWAEDNVWLHAGAVDVEEDRLKWDCTLFKPVAYDDVAQPYYGRIGTATTGVVINNVVVRLLHVHLGHYVCLFNEEPYEPYSDCLFTNFHNQPDKDERDVLVITQWDSSSSPSTAPDSSTPTYLTVEEELRQKLAQKDEDLKRLRKENEEALQKLRKEKDDEIQALRKHKDEELRQKDEDLKRLRKENEEALQKLRKEKDDEIQALRKHNDEDLKRLRKENEEALQKLRKEKDDEIQALRKHNDEELRQKLKKKDEEYQTLRTNKDRELEKLRQEKDVELSGLRIQLSAKDVELARIRGELERCGGNSWALLPSHKLLRSRDSASVERIRYLSKRCRVPSPTFETSEPAIGVRFPHILKDLDLRSEGVRYQEVLVVDEETASWPLPKPIHVWPVYYLFNKYNWWSLKTTHPDGGLTMLAYYHEDNPSDVQDYKGRPVALPFTRDHTLFSQQLFFFVDFGLGGREGGEKGGKRGGVGLDWEGERGGDGLWRMAVGWEQGGKWRRKAVGREWGGEIVEGERGRLRVGGGRTIDGEKLCQRGKE
ncbi:unnamed protein product [Linum tenue]|uniref:Agglutinin domain-containing protein n=1 Tax=Linum tenue TaxID=586396 RepID=A0AAV0NAP6_9ROSI|nr:unnamed protein product [Linum tenue]